MSLWLRNGPIRSAWLDLTHCTCFAFVLHHISLPGAQRPELGRVCSLSHESVILYLLTLETCRDQWTLWHSGPASVWTHLPHAWPLLEAIGWEAAARRHALGCSCGSRLAERGCGVPFSGALSAPPVPISLPPCVLFCHSTVGQSTTQRLVHTDLVHAPPASGSLIGAAQRRLSCPFRSPTDQRRIRESQFLCSKASKPQSSLICQKS